MAVANTEPVLFPVETLDTSKPGLYAAARDVRAYAVITEREGNRRIRIMRILIPHGSLVSVTHDRKRAFGRKYRVCTDTAKVMSIFDEDEVMHDTVDFFKDFVLRVGETYQFDFVHRQIFIVPSYSEVLKIVTYLTRYPPRR